ncbi:hypothetical protein ABZ946_00355 [Streptomyces sp. NPDC046324]|uniref:hypothetical protein n=1 Tax=Streptomyces sp. NPDC046324 TaxID=3154915 RepID=UPI0033C70833
MTAPFEWTGIVPALMSVVIPGLTAAVHLYGDRRRSRGGTQGAVAADDGAAVVTVRIVMTTDPGGTAAHVSGAAEARGTADASSAKERAPW